MTCPSQTYSGGETDNTAFTNWAGRFSGPVNKFFQPASLADLVNVLESATSGGHTVHVVGSGWAFENGAYSPDWMISLARLNQEIKEVTGTALNATWIANQNAGTAFLIHMQAGATIADVNTALDAKGQALASMGGANGQALAGAISTSTHGGDLQIGPLADLVMAMHLVTVGGREIWIERASQPITEDYPLAQALTCRDTEIVRDDAVFNALLVGFGRFGVIYSYVLKVQPAFRLAEWTTQISRTDLTAKLRAGIAAKTFPVDLLAILPNPPFTDVSIMNPRGLEVVFDTNNLGNCYVKRRWITTNATDVNMGDSANPLCVAGAFGVLNAGLAVLGPMVAIPFFGIAVSAEMAALSASYTADPGMSAGAMLAKVVTGFWNLGLGGSIPAITGVEFGAQYQASMSATGKVGKSWLVISGFPDQSLQSCYRADSIEPVFDAFSSQYVDFLDAVLDTAPQFQQAGYVSLRWSAASQATMSMHNVPVEAVSIEVTSLKDLPGNASWMSRVHALAVAHAGRPHWGQINQLDTPTTSALYATALPAWTSALGGLVGSATMFSNAYTVQRGLEPPAGTTAPTIFGRTAGDILADVLPAIHLLLAEDPALIIHPPIYPKPPFKPILPGGR